LGIGGGDQISDGVIGDGLAIACGIGFADLTVEGVVSMNGAVTEGVSGPKQVAVGVVGEGAGVTEGVGDAGLTVEAIVGIAAFVTGFLFA
jgi:hypothetical protein